MNILEILWIIFGTFAAALFIVFPFILPMILPYIRNWIYKLACYMTDDEDHYDENLEYIS